MHEVNTGACLCGTIRFRTKGALREVVACHCSQCRKQTGLYYAATNVRLDAVELEGEDHVTWYSASAYAKRGFCRTCGSALFWKAEGDDHISIMAGAFDGPTGLRMAYHIFCADKGEFYEITDGFPQYAKSNGTLQVAPEE